MPKRPQRRTYQRATRHAARGKAPEKRSASLAGTYNSGGFAFLAPALSGIVVTPQTALNYSAWFCGVNTISTDVSVLPFNVHRRIPGGGSIIDEDKPQNELIFITPNEETNAQCYWQTVIAHALCWPGSFSKIARAGDGTPTGLELLHPGQTTVVRRDGQLLYRTDRGDNVGIEYLLPENVLHIRGLGFDSVNGYNVTMMARQAIGLGMAAEEFGASFFGNGAVPLGVLEHPGELGETAQKNLRESINRVHQGTKNAHNMLILEEGMKYNAITFSPQVAQFLETRGFQVKDIARFLNMPPHKLGDYSESKYSVVEQANLDYLARTLIGWVTRLEVECNVKLLTRQERKEWFCAHNLWSLLKGSMKDRADFYTKLLALGTLTPNQICAMENLNPFGPAGDRRLVSANLKSLEQVESAAPAQPADNAAEEEQEQNDQAAAEVDEDEDDTETEDGEATYEPSTNGAANGYA